MELRIRGSGTLLSAGTLKRVVKLWRRLSRFQPDVAVVVESAPYWSFVGVVNLRVGCSRDEIGVLGMMADRKRRLLDIMVQRRNVNNTARQIKNKQIQVRSTIGK